MYIDAGVGETEDSSEETTLEPQERYSSANTDIINHFLDFISGETWENCSATSDIKKVSQQARSP